MMLDEKMNSNAIKLGDKLLESIRTSGTLPTEIAKRFQQKDLTTHMLYSGEDKDGGYIIAWLAERCITTLPSCLRDDQRFNGKGRYHELTLSASSPVIDLNFKVQFYQDLYPFLYQKLQNHFDKQVIVRVCFTENHWLREIGFGPYEEIAYIPESLCSVALTSVEAEAYHHFMQGDAIEITADHS